MATESQIRTDLLSQLARQVLSIGDREIVRVAIDGVDGAGKTTFADELAATLESCGRAVIRASVDSFHHPKSLRYRQGRDSPVGFFEDSFDYGTLTRRLLDPLSPGGTRVFRRGAFDHVRDRAVDALEERAPSGAVLIVDGIFLHRPELRRYWDYSVFLDVPFETSIARCAARDGLSPDPEAESNRRHVEGQRLYLSLCQPRSCATVVVANANLETPAVVGHVGGKWCKDAPRDDR